jgi:uncharacterized membrane-anchored protein YitT (DUF2179 family)
LKTAVLTHALLIFAGLLYASAFKYFVLPSRVILTGTEGVAAAFSYYFDSYNLFIILYICFQAALIIFAFFKVSKLFAYRTFVVIATVIAALALLPELQFAQPEPQNERIILVIFGGLLAGAAKAIAFKYRGSTADEDILGAYFAMKYLKPVGFISIIAGIISTAFGMFMDLLKNGQYEIVVNTLMYTCIYIFVFTSVLNNFYRKFKLCMLSIMTKHHEKVGQAIRDLAHKRTYTLQQGIGGYSKEPVWIVTAVVTHEELPLFIQALKHAEPNAFYYHNDLEGISSGYYISPI